MTKIKQDWAARCSRVERLEAGWDEVTAGLKVWRKDLRKSVTMLGAGQTRIGVRSPEGSRDFSLNHSVQNRP
jgi:hypothetical protein